MSKFKQREMSLSATLECDECQDIVVEQAHIIQSLRLQIEMLRTQIADASDREWRDALDSWFDQNNFSQLEFNYNVKNN